MLVSEATLDELVDVLVRPKFDCYLTLRERQDFFHLIGRVAQLVSVIHPIQACRHPRDDKFLALAVNGEADLIITGDRDLLVLNPFRGVPIFTPAVYLSAAWKVPEKGY